jgi:DNA-binding MarR family transcriptional regulator
MGDNKEANKIGFLLWQAGNAWQRKMKVALMPVGLTHVQFLLLETLENMSVKKEPTTQVKIAKAAGIDVMMTSKVLRLLVRKKFVARKSPRHDARAFFSEVTPEGKKVLVKARTAVTKAEETIFENLSKKKRFVANLKGLVGE